MPTKRAVRRVIAAECYEVPYKCNGAAVVVIEVIARGA